MIPVLLDPWLITFSPAASSEESNAKARALNLVFEDYKHRFPINILPFISEDEHAEFWQLLKRYRNVQYARVVTKCINHLVLLHESQVEPAKIIDAHHPEDLSHLWRKILAVNGNTDLPPKWRSPMLLIPDVRRSEWPDAQEIRFKTLNDEDNTKTRNLIKIEQLSEHKYFCSDLDPWRLGCVGEPKPDGPVEFRHATCRRLPRPPQLHTSLPLGQLVDELQLIPDWDCSGENEYFYLPRTNWDPTVKDKPSWRDRVFETKLVQRGKIKGATGYLDRDGRIWVWHEGENHWDVQIDEGIKYEKVCYTGKRLKKTK